MTFKNKTLLLVCTSLLCVFPADGQKRSPARTNRKSEAPLAPLTDAERRLDLRGIVANQPDHIADQSFFYNEGFGGFGASRRVSRKGDKSRVENGFFIVISEPGKAAVRLYPDTKSYNDLETGIGEEAPGAGAPFNPKMLAEDSGVRFTALGTEIIDGHKCIKIQATRKNSTQRIFLYSAEDLDYLIIVARVVDSRRSSVQKLSNISLNVPDDLFAIPPDYKGVEHRLWKKVVTAKVSYGGKVSKDYGVFRSPADELFVWVDDAPYPWHYLVRLKEATAEVAFQGTLVTKMGKYVWQTDETEAFSGPD